MKTGWVKEKRKFKSLILAHMEGSKESEKIKRKNIFVTLVWANAYETSENE